MTRLPWTHRLRTLALVFGALVMGCIDNARVAGDVIATRQRAARCAPESLAVDLTSVLVAMHRRNPVPGISGAVLVPAVQSAPALITVGMSALSGGHVLTADDRFLAGSVGKTFFAALALRRSAEGLFPLDDPLSTFIANTRILAFAWITPRMLLAHRSGIGEYDAEFMTALVRDPLRVRVREDWLGVVRRNAPPRDSAGTFRYSDLNYVLLAMALDSRETGGVYRAIENAYLRPLALTGTVPSTTPCIAQLVDGYEGASSMFGRDAMRNKEALIYNPQFEWGGGGSLQRREISRDGWWLFARARRFRIRSGQRSLPNPPVSPTPLGTGGGWAFTWTPARSAYLWPQWLHAWLSELDAMVRGNRHQRRDAGERDRQPAPA